MIPENAGAQPETPQEIKARLAQALEKLLLKTVEGALAAVSVEKPTASSLQAARSILSENDINLKTLASLRGGRNPLGALANSLPTFTDEPDEVSRGGQPQSEDALRNVPPFAAEPTEDDAD
ncbi:hypothetical protein [Reyranella sp.]|uniref:hypothetical protein n=1 Tax=Reyranella sp. TaxID=1929291 RepID=UPI004035DCB2